ncbi:hypothetical protein F5X68DRAFT_265506 [Plectosphaerella plurivora]|uniref:Uncharacterized protein n=1 Tax=Plectosphaerella plurivora TaxID=936078 RepID=A0A9P8V2B2_9PEZI|nr:hypothetical protein F5X68DRAFT_265506 [Plectosphaerella plurivora]
MALEATPTESELGTEARVSTPDSFSEKQLPQKATDSPSTPTGSPGNTSSQQAPARQMQITDFFQPKQGKAAKQAAEDSVANPKAESEECPPSASPLRIIRELHNQIDAFNDTASFCSDKTQKVTVAREEGNPAQPCDADDSELMEESFVTAATTMPKPKPLRTVRSQGAPLNAAAADARYYQEIRPAMPTEPFEGKARLEPGVPVRFDFSMKAETHAPRNMEEAMAIANSSKMAPPIMLPPRRRFKTLDKENDVFSQDFATATPVKRAAPPGMPPPPVGERANLSATFNSLRSVKSFSTWRKADISPDSLKRAVSTIREKSPLRKNRGRNEDGTQGMSFDTTRMSGDSIRPSDSMSVCGGGNGQSQASGPPFAPPNPIWPVSDEEARRQRLQRSADCKTQFETLGQDAKAHQWKSTTQQNFGTMDKSLRQKSSRAILAAQRAGLGSRDSGSQNSWDSSEYLDMPKHRKQRPGLMDWETFIKEEPAAEVVAQPETGRKTKRFFTSMFKKSKKGESEEK